MTVVILCEKKEQGLKVGKGLGLQETGRSCEGTYKGRCISVVWAAGHLLRLDTPEEAKADVSWNSIESLMPVPIPVNKKPTDRGTKYLPNIGRVLKNASEVWIGTDPDREGEAIGRDILAHHHYKGVVRRMWMTGTLEPKDIQKYADSLLDGSAHIPKYKAQEARNRSDWLWQLLVMGYTYAGRLGVLGEELSKGKGKAGVVSLGRVQTTALFIVVERDKEIAAFVPTDHYKLAINIKGLTLKYQPIALPESKIEGVKILDNGDPLFTDIETMKAFGRRVREAKDATIVTATYKDKAKNPPAPHSLDTLQTAAFHLAGLTSAETLKVADKLRLDGFLTYPRTEHREVPVSLYNKENLHPILASCASFPSLEEGAKSMMDAHPSNHIPRCFTKKPMEHHGIIPTEKAPEIDALSHSERAVYFECCRAFVTAMMPPAQFKTLSLVAQVNAHDPIDNDKAQFKGNFQTLVNPGWIAFDQKVKGKSDAKEGKSETENKEGGSEDDIIDAIPSLKEKEVHPFNDIALTKAVTKSPSRYTEATLRKAMKNAGRFAVGESAKVLRETKGIGTPATRAAIIEILMSREYIVRKGKGSKAALSSTPKAQALIANIPSELRDVNNTAAWEMQLKAIESAPSSEEATRMRDAFVQQQKGFIESHLKRLNGGVQAHIQEHGNKRKYGGNPTPKMLKLAKSIAKDAEIKLPKEAKESFAACKSFIDANISTAKRSGNTVKKPSEKMISYAKSLAKANGITLKGELDSFKSCSEFINKHAKQKA